MNKLHPFRLAMAALSAAIVVSCRIGEPLPAQEEIFTVTASIENGAQTRLTYSKNDEAHTVTPKWSIGDKVFGMDDKGGCFDFTVADITSDGIALFDIGGYVPHNATRLHAIYYPGHSSADFDDEGVLKVDLSAQSGSLDLSTPAIMISSADIEGNEVNFGFWHCCAVIGMEEFSTFANSTVTEVTLGGVAKSGTLEVIDGRLQLTADSQKGAVTASGLSVATDGSGYAKEPVYFAVLPSGKTTISLCAKSANYAYNNTKAINVKELKAGLYYRLNKSLSACKALIVETGVGYTSFEAALEAANESTADCTLKLLTNITADSNEIQNANGAKVTLDLAGRKLTLNGRLGIHSLAEITDSSAPDSETTGAGIISCSQDTTLLVGAGANLTISNGTITCSKASTYTVYATNGADLTIRGGARITSTSYRPLIVKGTASATKNTVATISGGWLQCPNGQCNVVVTRETTTGYKKGLLTVTGGHFKCAGTYSSSNRCFYRGYTNCTISIYGGFYDSNSLYRYYNGSPENYTAGGCEIVSTQQDYPEEYSSGYTHYVKGDKSETGLNASIRELISRTGAVNLAILAYSNGKTIYEKAFGYRCIEEGNVDTLEVQDVFRIASITKNFVSAAMMVLLDQDKIDLDDDVNLYLNSLPEAQRFSVRNPAYPSTPITIRMLLNHTSSITGNVSSSNRADCFQNIRYSSAKPGTAYEYTNMGATVAGAVVELASGQRLDDFVRENILQKIGMPHSDFDSSKIDTTGSAKFVHLYRANGERFYESIYCPLLTPSEKAYYTLGYNTGIIGPAGNIKSNLQDLARYAQTFQRGGVSPDGVRVISEKNVMTMINSYNAGTTSAYGFFTMRNTTSVAGSLLAGHNGAAYGASTYLMYGMDQDATGNALPATPGSANDWGIVVLASGNNDETAIGPAILSLVYSALIR